MFVQLNAKDEAKQEVRRLQNMFEEQERQSNARYKMYIYLLLSRIS